VHRTMASMRNIKPGRDTPNVRAPREVSIRPPPVSESARLSELATLFPGTFIHVGERVQRTICTSLIDM
jgi:hypothetical protein